MRVLGVDPGLTRCGIGVVEGGPGRPRSWSGWASSVPRRTATRLLRLVALERAME